MENFINQFLGSHGLAFHLAGLLFCLLGAFVAKAHFWKKHKAQCEGNCLVPVFNWKFWINDNWLDVLLSLIVSFLMVRFIDVFLHWLNPKISVAFGWEIPLTEDQIFYYLIIGFFIQFWIHKTYKSSTNSKRTFTGGHPDPDKEEK